MAQKVISYHHVLLTQYVTEARVPNIANVPLDPFSDPRPYPHEITFAIEQFVHFPSGQAFKNR
ncbi:MAG: hypothetical protein WCF22_04575 [Candidatus Sulfotelmatobacter sp.]